MERSTAEFVFQFSNKTVKICPFGSRLDTCHRLQAFRDFLEIPFFPEILTLK